MVLLFVFKKKRKKVWFFYSVNFNFFGPIYSAYMVPRFMVVLVLLLFWA